MQAQEVEFRWVRRVPWDAGWLAEAREAQGRCYAGGREDRLLLLVFVGRWEGVVWLPRRARAIRSHGWMRDWPAPRAVAGSSRAGAAQGRISSSSTSSSRSVWFERGHGEVLSSDSRPSPHPGAGAHAHVWEMAP